MGLRRSSMKADFHMHSCFSDGSETIMQIFSLAKEQGLKAAAITDHDTILGMKEEEKASKKSTAFLIYRLRSLRHQKRE